MRLIDADRVVATLTAENTRDDDTLGYADGLLDGIEVYAEALRNAPTIDAEPVVHATWIPKDTDGSWRVDTCSACKKDTHYVRYAPAYDFCPNCGAKMDGGERDAVD